MSRQDRPGGPLALWRRRPTFERMEGRVLLAVASAASPQFFAASAAQVQGDYHAFVTQLRNMELRSHATPEQYRALRDDARALSDAASAATTDPQSAQARALAATLQIDRAPLDGWLDPAGWADLAGRLTANLAPLGVPQPLIDKTVGDMQAVASAVGLGRAGFVSYTDNFNRVRAEENSLPSGYGGYSDPGVYYTQHLRGFFRGWAVGRSADEAKLNTDLRALGTPAGQAVLHRDVQLLEALGAQVPSSAGAQMLDAYAAAFADGPPTTADLDRLRAGIRGALGPVVSGRHSAQVDRLVADAPAFSQAAGASPANVQTLTQDILAVINDGGGSSLNPFKIQVLPAPRGNGNE
jgi:hypothetical protein